MSAQHTPAKSSPKLFGVFVEGAVLWRDSEEEARATAARLESLGLDVMVDLHPDAYVKATSQEGGVT